MSLGRGFLLGFILSFVATALIAVFVILFGKWGDAELKILLSAVSIGVYSLIALCCSTLYSDKSKKHLSMLGIAICGVGLAFALLTNWRLISSNTGYLLNMRLHLLTFAMTMGAICLMLRIEASNSIVEGSRLVTILLILITTAVANYVIFFNLSKDGDFQLPVYKILAASSILGLVGVVLTPLLKKVTNSDPSSPGAGNL